MIIAEITGALAAQPIEHSRVDGPRYATAQLDADAGGQRIRVVVVATGALAVRLLQLKRSERVTVVGPIIPKVLIRLDNHTDIVLDLAARHIGAAHEHSGEEERPAGAPAVRRERTHERLCMSCRERLPLSTPANHRLCEPCSRHKRLRNGMRAP